MSKLCLNTCTLVTVSSVRIEDTVAALVHSARKIECASVKFISDTCPRNLPSFIEYCPAPRIGNLDAYSRFMIYDLAGYIETPHCLTIHRDGGIVHPQQWREEFLEYDYIGAPWPVDRAFCGPDGEQIRVGNGGFSLRSKKLLECAQRMQLPFHAPDGCLHEDRLICVTWRRLFEQAGIRFAPLDVACHFSHEMAVPEIRGIKPFGFHQFRKQNRFYPRFPSRMTRLLRRVQSWLPPGGFQPGTNESTR